MLSGMFFIFFALSAPYLQAMGRSPKSPTPNPAEPMTVDITSAMKDGTWSIREFKGEGPDYSITYQAQSSHGLEFEAIKSKLKTECYMLRHIELQNGLSHIDRIELSAKCFDILANLCLKQRQKKQ